MLIQLQVENFRSLRDEQVLSLVAAHLDTDDPRLIREPKLGEALLPTVALYGANASGKTNVLLALEFMRDAVVNSHRLWEPTQGVPLEPFALSERRHQPSRFEVDLFLGGVRYRYGFVLSSQRVEQEWLSAWPQRRQQIWFERDHDKFRFGRSLGGENEAIRNLTRSNSLFLSAAAQNNHPKLSPIFAWFAGMHFEQQQSHLLNGPLWMRLLQHMFPASDQLALFPDQQVDRDALLRLLRTADTGILDFRFESEPAGEGSQKRRRPPLYFRHQAEDGKEYWLPADAESGGTLALLRLAISLLPVLRHGGVLCIDELDASLHTTLSSKLLSLFSDPKHNAQGAQLIFTTHDTNLLGSTGTPAVLRRDQIWFTEKDTSGATHLYPLTDFHPRKEENLERGYLQGRYGAIPFLGALSFFDDAER